MKVFGKKMSVYNEDEPEDVLQPIAPIEPITKTKEVQQTMLQMKLVRPKRLDEATDIADSLKSGQTIVLNLEDLSDAHARRVLDYVAGVIYAVNGKIERPADRTFLLTPRGVIIATDENK